MPPVGLLTPLGPPGLLFLMEFARNAHGWGSWHMWFSMSEAIFLMIPVHLAPSVPLSLCVIVTFSVRPPLTTPFKVLPPPCCTPFLMLSQGK